MDLEGISRLNWLGNQENQLISIKFAAGQLCLVNSTEMHDRLGRETKGPRKQTLNLLFVNTKRIAA